MFLLTGKTIDKTYSLQQNRTYTIGREDADIIINIKTISRKQAVIDVKDHYIILADCNSLSGTQVNQKGIISNKKYKVVPGASITFGIHTEFVLQKFKMIVTTSNLHREEKERFLHITNKLNIQVMNKWIPDITHIFVSRKFVTTKIISALIKKQYIVSIDFLHALEISVASNLPLPREQDFLIHSFGDDSITFNYDADRTKLFANRTAIFCEEEDRRKYGMLVELCGGRSISLHDYPEIKEDFINNDEYFVTCFKYHSPLCKRIIQLQTLLKQARKRLIPPPEICHAIISVSIEHFCNPIYKNEMLFNGYSLEHVGSIIVPETQSSSQALVDNEIIGATNAMEGVDASGNSQRMRSERTDIIVNRCSELPAILSHAKLGIDIQNGSVEGDESSKYILETLEKRQPIQGNANHAKETNIIVTADSALPELSIHGRFTKPEHYSIINKKRGLGEKSSNPGSGLPDKKQQVLGRANDGESYIRSSLKDVVPEETNIIAPAGSALPEITIHDKVTKPGDDSMNIKKENLDEESSKHKFGPLEQRNQVIGELNDSFKKPRDTRISPQTAVPTNSFSNKIEILAKPEKKLFLKHSKRKEPVVESSSEPSVKAPVSLQSKICTEVSSTSFCRDENSTFLTQNLTKPSTEGLSLKRRKVAIKSGGTVLCEESDFAKVYMQNKTNNSKASTMPENEDTDTTVKCFRLKRKNPIARTFRADDIFTIPGSNTTTTNGAQESAHIQKQNKTDLPTNPSMLRSRNKKFRKQKLASFPVGPIRATRVCQ